MKRTNDVATGTRTDARRAGVTLIYVTVIMALLMGVVSLAVDWGRVQLAKTELQSAADAAARAASASFPQGTVAARDAAVLWASRNKADGSAVTLVDSSTNDVTTDDVVFGQWDPATRTLNTASPTPNAIRVTARRAASRGTA